MTLTAYRPTSGSTHPDHWLTPGGASIGHVYEVSDSAGGGYQADLIGVSPERGLGSQIIGGGLPRLPLTRDRDVPISAAGELLGEVDRGPLTRDQVVAEVDAHLTAHGWQVLSHPPGQATP